MESIEKITPLKKGNAKGGVPSNPLRPDMVAETFISLAETLVARKQSWNFFQSTLHVGVLVFDKFRLGEALRIMEIVRAAQENVRTSIIAEKRGFVESSSGTVVMVDCSFSDVPQLDLLIIPAMDCEFPTNRKFLTEFRQLISNSQNVLAIGSGALVLAQTGLLDGLRAHVNAVMYDRALSLNPKVNWEAEARWVIDDKFFTTADQSVASELIKALAARLIGPKMTDQTIPIDHL